MIGWSIGPDLNERSIEDPDFVLGFVEDLWPICGFFFFFFFLISGFVLLLFLFKTHLNLNSYDF